MSAFNKWGLMGLGVVTALLTISQFVMGLLIRRGAGTELRALHFHSGSAMMVVALVFIAWALVVIASIPTRSTARQSEV
ncbi:hypothetical protein Isop_2649 [Isosphaera pallida ATCC 43644]|uniref:Uncharacterized protein n=1 Tax=Isosphaera pallida (strain ATCC 43644 / DSM 9630 / IS1B) TaxID=575540 RepID=E8QZS8_ISOPI|nr:hypothetical protein [Isosphaera pallida]ADV63219.1 hypothetical protein Isop_2649 [Isosphaera pallida ATCC 43644]